MTYAIWTIACFMVISIVTSIRDIITEIKYQFSRKGVMTNVSLREEGRGLPRPTTSLKKTSFKTKSSRRQAEPVV